MLRERLHMHADEIQIGRLALTLGRDELKLCADPLDRVWRISMSTHSNNDRWKVIDSVDSLDDPCA